MGYLEAPTLLKQLTDDVILTVNALNNYLVAAIEKPCRFNCNLQKNVQTLRIFLLCSHKKNFICLSK